MHLPICLSVDISCSVFFPMYLNLHLCLAFLPLSFYFTIHLCLSVCLFVCLCVYLAAFLSVCLSCLSVCLSACMGVGLIVFLSVCLSICLSLRLSFLIDATTVCFFSAYIYIYYTIYQYNMYYDSFSPLSFSIPPPLSLIPHLPLRLKDSIQASLSEMEGVHKEMSVDYSHGVVAGYTRKFLDATSHQKYVSPWVIFLCGGKLAIGWKIPCERSWSQRRKCPGPNMHVQNLSSPCFEFIQCTCLAKGNGVFGIGIPVQVWALSFSKENLRSWKLWCAQLPGHTLPGHSCRSLRKKRAPGRKPLLSPRWKQRPVQARTSCQLRRLRRRRSVSAKAEDMLPWLTNAEDTVLWP